jgi:hypothetical protein
LIKKEENKTLPLKSYDKLKLLNDYSFCPKRDSPQWEG